jgi:hypothetical protein
MRIDEALSKIEKKLTYDAEDMFPDHNAGFFTSDADIAAQAAVELKRRNYVANELTKKRAEYMRGMTLDDSTGVETVSPGQISAEDMAAIRALSGK